MHSRNIAVVPIIDPAIKIDNRLRSYRDGLHNKIFLQSANDDGQLYEGRVWPGRVHFMDFLHQNMTTYLRNMLKYYQKTINFDGLWLDMNEPSNFDSGPVFEPTEKGYFSLNHPKYDINNGDCRLPIYHQTVPMDVCHQNRSLRMYETHNIYGLTEAVAFRKALHEIMPNKRVFLLTRSVFPGSLQFTASWLGDNHSTFEQLKESIWGVLKMAMFSGMAMTGPDLCGFNGEADDELCARWMAVGAFFPFSRNHNSISSRVDQEPYNFNTTLLVTKKYYAIKYSLLPYWMTLYEMHRRRKEMVMRPFSMVDDENGQFFVGRDILVCPVTTRGATSVLCKFPDYSMWYEFETGNKIKNFTAITIDAPISHLPVFVRAGAILLKKEPQLTVTDTLKTNYTLSIYLDDHGRANGRLYYDDNTTANVGNHYTNISIECKVGKGQKRARLLLDGYYGFKSGLWIDKIEVFGGTGHKTIRHELPIDKPQNIVLEL